MVLTRKALLKIIKEELSAFENQISPSNQATPLKEVDPAGDFKEMGALLQKADPVLDQLAMKSAETMEKQLEPLLVPHLAKLAKQTGLTPEIVKPMLLKKALALLSGGGEDQ